MPLLSSSETLTINSFLTAVDRGHDIDFDAISPDLADSIQITKGRDALAKATKDLMVLGGRSLFSSKSPTYTSSPGTDTGFKGSGSGHWPSFGPEGQGPAGPSSDPFSSNSNSPMNPFGASDPPKSSSEHYSASSSSLPPIRNSTSPYATPPMSDYFSRSAHLQSGSKYDTFLSPAAASASSSKRSLPLDGDASSSAPKRSRPSPPSTLDPQSKSRKPSSNTGKSRASAPSSKPALLSPSQKRANHIQSEQKRRANIRRGYESLCAAVPALREAIALEEASANTEGDSAGVKGKRKRKKGDENGLDGRAGPKSENVVLAKTIDYIKSLIADKETLLAHYQTARAKLSQDHPALSVTSTDEHGIPLWERQWNGGSGLAEDAGDDEVGEDDVGGSEDEE
ncbi:uncharacterized protein FIBRA_05220 [Fibroporia radiculosa]|uniref:BHLH domain-containing protein n=1 Tax=Fibroporia radiculosa TaxID=599839 RepID=J4GQL3_9APHY|nr:uncharacterized protein FIBRA_05220 [Fibroporia radiculosa]CCM03100.1 predicted protein [Fibroporia radiculosa]